MQKGKPLGGWFVERTLWQRRIHEPFIFAALGVALTAGFGYAALLVGGLALKIPLGAWWSAAVQAHGHAQLFGWMGLFIIGMGLYFLPKLGGVQLKLTERAPYGFALLLAGIVARSLAQPALGLEIGSVSFATAWRALWLASAVLELAGILLLASILLATHRAEPPITRGSPEWPVLPFIGVAFASLGLAFVLNAFATSSPALSSGVTLDPLLDALIIQLMLYGLAIPMAIVFSVRTLPLFLRLAEPPRNEMRVLGFVYALALIVRLSPVVSALWGGESWLVDRAGDLAGIAQSLVVLIFMWRLDLLRRRPPWTTQRAPNTRPDLEYLRQPTRNGFPDAGEYGRFELLVYSAYFWLAAVALMEIACASAALLGYGSPIPTDAERHAQTVGFVTLLIFGMAARLLPGFSHKRRLAYPWLVLATFVLGNMAALLRVVPLFFPSSDLSLALLAGSGAIGWLAVACLAVNVVRTVHS